MDWSDVIGQVLAEWANTAIPGSGPIVAALTKSLIQCQDEQIETLNRIEAKIDRILLRDWKTGRRYLEEATLPGRTEDQQKAALASAANKLREAVDAQEDGSVSKASVLVELAAVFLLQSDIELAEYYAKKARTAEEAARGWRRGMTEAELDFERWELRAIRGGYMRILGIYPYPWPPWRTRPSKGPAGT